MGAASTFAVLAGSGITNTGPTVVKGDVGTYPTITQTGFADMVINGTNHAGDDVTKLAKADLLVAFNMLKGLASNTQISGDLGGLTLIPGVYTASSSIGLTGTVTLDAQGNSDAVFVIRTGSTLVTASNSVVRLINGAQAKNVWWAIGSSATLGTGTAFQGTIIASASITVQTSTSVAGGVLALDGAVTLDQNVIRQSVFPLGPCVF